MVKKGKILLVIFVIAIIAMAAYSKTRECGEEKMPETYSIKTFLEPDWELAMHEVFINYLQAAATFGTKDYETSMAFLKVMNYYINMLPDKIPPKTPDGKPIDRTQFLKDIDLLRTNTLKLRQFIEKKDYNKVTEVAPDYITKLCTDCHKNAKVPPKWQIGGYKVSE